MEKNGVNLYFFYLILGSALFQWGGYIVPFAILGSILILAAIFSLFILPSSYNGSPPVTQVTFFCLSNWLIFKINTSSGRYIWSGLYSNFIIFRKIKVCWPYYVYHRLPWLRTVSSAPLPLLGSCKPRSSHISGNLTSHPSCWVRFIFHVYNFLNHLSLYV